MVESTSGRDRLGHIMRIVMDKMIEKSGRLENHYDTYLYIEYTG